MVSTSSKHWSCANFDTGVTSLGVFPSKDLDWIDKYGLLAAAREAVRPDLEPG